MAVWIESLLGKIYNDGEELELLGGLNFIGLTLTKNEAENRYDIETTPNLTPQVEYIEFPSEEATFGVPDEGKLRFAGSPTPVIVGRHLNGDVMTVLSLEADSASLENISTLNDATVIAPFEGTEITTTAVVGIDGGSLRRISSAGGAYSLGIDYDGSPIDPGEGITFYCLEALDNQITIYDFTSENTVVVLPPDFKGSVSAYLDGGEWFLAYGSIYRVP
jgi:hypothetical protein